MDNLGDNLGDNLKTILLEKEMKLATAESCTGGMVASSIISVAGSSKIFDRGFVTYSDNSKIEMLDVSDNIIRNYGAVSLSCAEAMALGALKHSDADISVAITGIAGPNGGSDEKPVGLVYICVAMHGKEPEANEFHFNGSRDEVRKASCEKALELLIDMAKTAIA